MNFEDALAMARTVMRIAGISPEEAVASQLLIPEGMRDEIRAVLEREREAHATIRIQDLRMIEEVHRHNEWLRDIDRQEWFYWPRLRHHLLIDREWVEPTVQSIDDATDRILGALENPSGDLEFDTRGLVVGYVQSGKTANYSALIAKAADTGYRLFVVLTGIHDSLRQQTQRRLNSELVGGEPGGVVSPADGRRRWLSYTTTDLKGDFSPGTVDTAALSGGQPALIVAKKNAAILRRLNQWLEGIPEHTKRHLPVLVIDDEADQASPNTRGNRPFPDEDVDKEEQQDDDAGWPPSRINELIRSLLRGFSRVAYVGYTATPFANVLIDHLADDRFAGQDLYPRSFIVDLPEPPDYYGAEKIFGSGEDAESRGMDVIRHVPEDDRELLVPRSRDDLSDFTPELPRSLRDAVDDYVLAASARYQRGDGDKPATMLIHASHYQAVQQRLHQRVTVHMAALRDEWRYDRSHGIEDRLRDRWEVDFRRVTRSENLAADVEFDEIRTHITTLLEHPVEVLQLNYGSEDELDYVRDPSLKVVVIGGNRLSRGLTLEGLLVSYYVRRANAYDTLMQMGRWFGYRSGYADLTRIHTTVDLEQWFRDLVSVEADLRADIRRYAEEGMTPLDFGVRIRRHPSLLVTDRLKMRAAQVESMSFAGQLVQTIIFPFQDRDWLEANLDATRDFLGSLGPPDRDAEGAPPTWRAVPWQRVIEFLDSYEMDPAAVRVNRHLLIDFLRRQAEQDELVEWTVCVMGQQKPEERLGTIDLRIENTPVVNLIERTRLPDQNSLGVITSPTHQALGLSDVQRERTQTQASGAPSGRRLREARDKREGLLLIYPISRMSGWKGGTQMTVRDRQPIYPTPEQAKRGVDIIGIALALPPSNTAATVEYVVGNVGVGDN